MARSYDKNAAVVVLPAIGRERLREAGLRRWLARADLTRSALQASILQRVLPEIGCEESVPGQAALRMWGQTGDRPSTWIAAADPVYLEPQLDTLCLHALRRSGVPPAELGPLFNHLQQTLGDDGSVGFARLGEYGYVTANQPIATASIPAYVIDQQNPSPHLPEGSGSEQYRRLLSEIEMALHDHKVNLERAEKGRQAVNSLWLWGGGFAPQQQTRPCPPLYSNDALLAGWWLSQTAVADTWPGSIPACLSLAVAGFVATVPPFETDDELHQLLADLKRALANRRLSSVTLVFEDGLRAYLARPQSYRFWRRGNSLLDASLPVPGRGEQ